MCREEGDGKGGTQGDRRSCRGEGGRGRWQGLCNREPKQRGRHWGMVLLSQVLAVRAWELVDLQVQAYQVRCWGVWGVQQW